MIPARFIPPGALKVSDKLSDAIAYLYASSNGAPCARVFYGKQSKPVVAYHYRDQAAREAAVIQAFKGRQARAAKMAEHAAERRAWTNDYRVGEVVNTCWGYDQTNREFYEVIEVKGKHVIIREIAVATKSAGYGTTENIVPLVGQYIGEPLRRLAQQHGIKTGKHSFTFATRSKFSEPARAVKVYEPQHISHDH
jgi:hypothetical protein